LTCWTNILTSIPTAASTSVLLGHPHKLFWASPASRSSAASHTTPHQPLLKMSSASETQTRTPHSRELSDRTGPTEYSPDILRFKHLSLESSDPFISTPLSPTAPPFRPDGAIDRDTFIRAIPLDPVAFGIVMGMMSKGPRPEPFVDLQLRRHGGSSFAQRDNGEPATSFVWASGEHHISMYHGHGPFSWVSMKPPQPSCTGTLGPSSTTRTLRPSLIQALLMSIPGTELENIRVNPLPSEHHWRQRSLHLLSRRPGC